MAKIVNLIPIGQVLTSFNHKTKKKYCKVTQKGTFKAMTQALVDGTLKDGEK